MNGNLLIAVDYIDIVPGCKVSRDLGVGRFISGAQMRERLPGKHHAPTKGIVRTVAFIDSDVVCGVGLLHKDGEVHAGRTATNDVDLHASILWSALTCQRFTRHDIGDLSTKQSGDESPDSKAYSTQLIQGRAQSLHSFVEQLRFSAHA